MDEKNIAPEFYTTLERSAKDEFEEKRSLFIGYASPIKTEDEALAFIKKVKNHHKDATHNVWAYVLDGGYTQRYSDDGEPQGTAGMPVLDTIRKSGCSDCVVVVTRYFGGTLLGAGGLVRAYSHGAKIALDAAHIITYEKYAVLRLVCSYSDYQKYNSEIIRSGAIMDDTDFADSVTLTFAMKKSKYPDFGKRLVEMSAGKVNCEIIGERFDYK